MSMGFAESYEVLQIRKRLLAWSNSEHPHQQRYLRNKTLIEEVHVS